MNGQATPPRLGEERRTSGAGPKVGELIRAWRGRRNLTQQAVAVSAGVSTRYLSFIETGRARPSRSMVARLAETLAVPLDARNSILVAAGYAPVFTRSELSDPGLEPVRHALGRLLAAAEPYPALLVDRCWNIHATNRGARLLTGGIAARVLEPAPNLVRLILHPAGLARRISNLDEWGASLLKRVRSRAELTCDEVLRDLYEEVVRYPSVAANAWGEDGSASEPLILYRLRSAGSAAELTLFSTVTTFPAARDVTVDELSVEAFFPADEATRAALGCGADHRSEPQSITSLVNAGMY